MPASCRCTVTNDCCTTVVRFNPLSLLVCLGLIYGFVRFIGFLFGTAATPSKGWIPFVLLGVFVAAWGLWLGHKVHGRGEPLAVGIFGIVVAVCGMLVYSPLVVVGVLTILAATIWSANLKQPASELR